MIALSVALLWSNLTLFAWDGGEDNTVDGASHAPDAAGSLRGVVRNEMGVPVAGVTVHLYNNDARYGSTHRDEPIAEVTTDAQGAYSFTYLPTNLYRLAVIDPTGAYPTPQYYANAPSLGAATEIPIGGTAVTDVDVVLQTGGRIRGQVTTLAGTPLAGVIVTAHANEQSPIQRTTTGPDGSYEIGGLGTAPYQLRFQDGNHRHFTRFYPHVTTLRDATPVHAVAGTVVAGINMVLLPGSTIQGTVVDSGGSPLAGIDISVTRAHDEAEFGPVQSKADGTYQMGPLTTGNYQLHFVDPTRRYESYTDYGSWAGSHNGVPVVEGEDTMAIQTTLPRRAIFRGRVTADDGAPLAGARVRLIPGGEYGFSDDVSALTDAQGNYQLVGAPRTAVYVEISHPNGLYRTEYYNDAKTLDDAVLFEAAHEQVIDVNASLAADVGAITGTITHTWGSSYSWFEIVAIRPDAAANASPAASISLPSTQTTYLLGGLAPGEYLVYAERGSSRGEYYDNAILPAHATRVRVVRGEYTRDINFVLGDGADYATISGTVRTVDGKPLSRARVTVYRKDESGVMGANAVGVAQAGQEEKSPWHRNPSRETDGNGQYNLSSLPPGTYRLQFDGPRRSDYAFEYYAAATTLADAQDIVLAPHQTQSNVDAALTLGGVVTGTVALPDGARVMGGRLHFYFWNGFGWEQLYERSLDLRSASYEQRGLQSGRYRLAVAGKLVGEEFTYFYGGATVIDDAADVVVTTGQTMANVDITIPYELFLNRAITGTVQLHDGTPASGIQVALYRSSAPPVVHTTTDKQGRYVLQALPTGSYFLSFVDPTGTNATVYNHQETVYARARKSHHLTLYSSKVISNVNATLMPGGAIHGRVTDRQRGLAGIEVTAYVQQIDYTTIPPGPGPWEIAHPAVDTDADGNYQIAGLLPETYRIAFRDPQGNYHGMVYGGGTDIYAARDIMVTAGTTTSAIDGDLLSHHVALTPQAYLPFVVHNPRGDW